QHPSIYLTRPESPESRRLDFPVADLLSISRSRELAILPAASVDFAFGSTLATVPMAGGVPRNVVDDVPYRGADWAPDGKSLAVVRIIDAKSRLEFPVGTVLATAAQLGAPQLAAPRFSPDGDWIAFVAWEWGEESVGLIDRVGKRHRKLSTGGSPINGLCWAPGGREIWFTASQTRNPGQPWALWAVNLSGKVRLVTRLPGGLEV